MAKQQDRKPPVVSFTAGLCEVGIWENEYDADGETKVGYAATVHRSYKDGNQWKNTKILRRNDLLAVSFLLQKAFDWINEQSRLGGDD